MSSMLSSQGVALATAMAAVSGTVILLSFCLQKSLPLHHTHSLPSPSLRSCISSETRRKKKKNQKRVHFANDVVDPAGDGEKFRRSWSESTGAPAPAQKGNPGRRMPANRVALYNGILRDRVVHRTAYSG